MRKLHYLLMIIALYSMTWTLQAQTNPTLACGDTLTGRLSDGNLLHQYEINIESSTTLIVSTDPLPLSAPLTLTVEIQNANGALISMNPYAPQTSASVIETSEILSGGVYQIVISGDRAGDYQLFVSCVSGEGDVISNNNLVQALACGQQVDNTMIRPDELHRYFLYLDDDSVMDIFLEALYGDFAEMTFEIGLYSPTNQELDRLSDTFKGIERRIVEQTITTEGIYRLYVKGFDSANEDYRLSIDCTLPNGDLALSGGESRRVLEPTLLTVSDPILSMPTPAIENTSTPADSELPPVIQTNDLIEGLPNTGQLMGDEAVVGYVFDGVEGERITLQYGRVRGDSRLDLWLRAPDGQMIFTSSLLLAESLSVQVVLPQSGEYQIFLTLIERPQVADAVFTIEVVRDQ